MSTSKTPLQQQAIADSQPDWSQTVTFTQFDPALGTLLGIDLGVTAAVAGKIAVESLEATASTITASLHGNVGVLGLPITAEGSLVAGLSGFDGTADNAGTSGTMLDETWSADTSSTGLLAGTAELAAYVGTGTVDLTATGSGWLSI